MAGATQAASSAAVLSAPLHEKLRQKQHPHRISFPVSAFFRSCFSRRPIFQIALDVSSNANGVAISKLDTKSVEDVPQESPLPAKEATISAIMTDVANLIKLVDTRDIIELELKHLDYELVIRKKEALPPPVALTVASPHFATQAPYPAYASPSQAPPPAPSAAPTPVPAPAAVSPPAPAAQPASDLPRILSPMAGTLYKSPAPGEPAFVQVGDKVTKGQVICIVEAMKLMNEIEADQTGTIVEILAEDGKPVSVDTALFAIRP
eukprot:c18496_g1_i1 orf=239-1030(+)